ncbi:MAG: cation:proton antiporter [Pseudomonadales bacterium]|nr:cation:proton antiporter [Pseudomonadales bacterium]
MNEPSIIFSFFIIFSGAAVLSTMALIFRQPMLIAYIGLGIIVGPFTLDLIPNTKMLDDVSEIGIIFLLFLLGLDMQPSSLLHTLKKTTTVALISSVLFAVLGFLLATIFGFSQSESIITGICMMFSSTIIGIKLLPTTVLHHKHTGELMVGILLLQDLIAILVLVGIGGIEQGASDILSYFLLIAAFPVKSIIVYGFCLIEDI